MSDTGNTASYESPHEISKKELLAATGISYGQLYRWKREGLIPEEWFEKRASYTGQETYFPRERALERVRAIRSMKDGLSLTEIRERLEELRGEAALRKALLAEPAMDEDFINSLGINLEQLTLTETSIQAVRMLATALYKADTSQTVRRSVMQQAIEALNQLSASVPGKQQAEAGV